MPDAAKAPGLARNPISILGAWITTIAALAFVAYYIAESLELIRSPYAGMLGFILLPALFVFGLLLIPFGMWREGRRRRRGAAAWAWPSIDLSQKHTRNVVIGVGVLTIANLLIVALAGTGAVHYM